jgi:prolyl-tRNA synthetase
LRPLQEEPLDASVPSHKLLLRAGIIRQLGRCVNARACAGSWCALGG